MSAHKVAPLTMDNIAHWCGISKPLSPRIGPLAINQIWNDSRQVGPADLFVAIATEHNDGHLFVVSALEKGAVGALVQKEAAKKLPAEIQDRLLIVKDPITALQRCARLYRQELGQLVIGVTGSSGKTTTRSFIAEVLSTKVPVGATVGNWNNHIGLPLSILRLDGSELAVVLEMGANHIGEIAPLSVCAAPDIAVITNIGYAHVGLFGSLAKTTQAKMEIIEGLNKRGVLLINGDDARLVKATAGLKIPVVRFGFSKNCDMRAEALTQCPDGICFSTGGQEYKLSMAGKHFVYAALPAIFIGRRCGCGEGQITKALASIKPVELRGVRQEKKGVSFIVDCYNANPSSMHTALMSMQETVAANKRVAVVGDMRELGAQSTRLHRQLGKELVATGIMRIVAVGEYATVIAAGAISAGLKPEAIVCVADAASAVKGLRSMVRKGDTVLLKASRLIGLEKVLALF